MKKRLPWLLALLVFALLLTLVWRASWRHQVEEQELRAQQQLQVYRTALESEITRFENIPRALQSHPVLTRALQYPSRDDAIEQANRLLQHLAQETGVEALYLIGADGVTLAASNWHLPHSFIGQNYRYRPYFSDALRGSVGEFYALGATTRTPGYFFGLHMTGPDGAKGVLAAKITLLPLEHSWQPARELVLVVDREEVIALSSRAELKFRTLAPLTPAARQRLEDARQYTPMPLTPLAVTYDRHQVEWQGEQYGVSELALPRLQWRMQLWWPSRQLAMNATQLSALTGVGLIAVLLLLLYWRQRRRYYRMQLRARSELEQQVMSRTAALAATNRELEQQIQERIQAEARLRSMQHELIHSNRLAALGQMAAGVAHEVNQPLTALRNQSVNTLLLSQHGRHHELEASLQTMGRLIDRIARLTSQLKLFAATRRHTRGQTRLNEALDNILSWLAPRLAEQRIHLERPTADEVILPMELHALEQVLANLLTNSIDALTGTNPARIIITAGPDWLQWQDNGPGISPELADKVTEPFFSTKQTGHGLGLGLSIVRDLVEASDGRLNIQHPPEGGIRFRIDWSNHDPDTH
ncbi:ATP-binding protein [Oceanimonas pelagia]|uniref:histidine kinase n=1 Tax=Oceanimonas pelagia TaxID=3028314 RepID=A0AA50QCN0_9GAMM|nr:ATP-binding protein [Oceanimonas pelagia]WMC11304.1 ATP-binding protein [Oceanimonas pelagia]